MKCLTFVRASVVIGLLGCWPLVGVGCGESQPVAEPDTEGASAAALAPQLPNIVIVVVDTLRQDALRAYNAEAQPLDAIDAFSARAAVFEDALAPSSWTLPSLTSLLTGKYPDRHGAAHPRLALSEDVPTLATAAQHAGYETIAFTDGAYVSPQFGLARGFDWFNDTAGPDARPMPDLPRGGAIEDVPGTSLFDRGLHFLRARKPGDKPFLLLLHTYSVHDYFREHPWIEDEIAERPAGMQADSMTCLIGGASCPEGIWPYFRNLYDAEIRHMDRGFQLLSEALRDTGLDASTLVMLTSDHGEGFEPDRGRKHHGGRLHEDMLRIPLLVAGPGIAPRRVPGPVSLIDVAPTFLDVMGVAPLPAAEGISLVPALNAEPLPDRPIFAFEYFYWWREGARESVASIAVMPLALAVADGPHLFTRHQGREEVWFIGAPLYAASALDDPQVLQSLKETLSQRDTRLRPGDSRADDAELQEKLRSLGYVE